MRLGREDVERFTEVDPLAQFGDCCLPRQHFFGAGRRTQPVGQGLFAGFGAGGVDQLEQRAAPEQVEVACVEMRTEEAGAVRSGAGPRAVEPRQPALVVATRPQQTLVAVQQARVHHQQRQERHGGQHQPRRTE